tara:strand:+ start:66 stop:368 length:303 start_codon:yes stop_codon:yes gene_type:complete
MITKTYLQLMLEVAFDDPIDFDVAWACYERFNDYINNGDTETINYFIKAMTATRTEILATRFRMAEMGYELTPSQLTQYFFILSTCLLDKARLFKEKNEQ